MTISKSREAVFPLVSSVPVTVTV
jgi:hypothetical protein